MGSTIRVVVDHLDWVAPHVVLLAVDLDVFVDEALGVEYHYSLQTQFEGLGAIVIDILEGVRALFWMVRFDARLVPVIATC
jgi:hypothetical protein